MKVSDAEAGPTTLTSSQDRVTNRLKNASGSLIKGIGLKAFYELHGKGLIDPSRVAARRVGNADDVREAAFPPRSDANGRNVEGEGTYTIGGIA